MRIQPGQNPDWTFMLLSQQDIGEHLKQNCPNQAEEYIMQSSVHLLASINPEGQASEKLLNQVIMRMRFGIWEIKILQKHGHLPGYSAENLQEIMEPYSNPGLMIEPDGLQIKLQIPEEYMPILYETFNSCRQIISENK